MFTGKGQFGLDYKESEFIQISNSLRENTRRKIPLKKRKQIGGVFFSWGEGGRGRIELLLPVERRMGR